MKHWFIAATLACSLAGHAVADDALKAAIASPQRTPANAVRDTARHPYETLDFFGLKSNMKVVELAPGAGWYTEILGPYLREHGQLIEAGFDPASTNSKRREYAAEFRSLLDSKPAMYDKVKLTVFEPPAKLDFAPTNSVDMVLTFRNVHNWAAVGDDAVKATFKQVYDSLKPGGVFGVVDHRLPVAMKQDAKASTGYLHEDYVIKLAESVGFKLTGKSEVNANPKDDANHPEGVWTLPPTYALKDKDHAKYEAIGESDRFTLKFVKPS